SAPLRAGRFSLSCRRGGWTPAHVVEHSGSWPTIELETVGFLVGAERRAGLHAGLAIDLVLVEPARGQSLLHRFHVGGTHQRALAPWRLEMTGIHDAITHMADEQHVKIREIVVLDDEIILWGQKCRSVDSSRLQHRGGFGEFIGAHPPSICRNEARRQPLPDRSHHFGHSLSAIEALWGAHLVGPTPARLPTLVGELFGGRGESIGHRMPDVAATVAVEVDGMLVEL